MIAIHGPGGLDAGASPSLYEPAPAAVSPIIEAAKVAKLPSVA